MQQSHIKSMGGYQTLISALPLCLCRAVAKIIIKLHFHICLLHAYSAYSNLAVLPCSLGRRVLWECVCVLNVSEYWFLSRVIWVRSSGSRLYLPVTHVVNARALWTTRVCKLCIVKCSKDRCASARFNSCDVCVCGSWCCVYGVAYVLIDAAAKCKVQLHNIEWAIRNNGICGHLRKRHANGPPRRVP